MNRASNRPHSPQYPDDCIQPSHRFDAEIVQVATMHNELVLTNFEPSDEIGTAIDQFKKQGRRSSVVYATSRAASAAFLIDAFERRGLPAPRIIEALSDPVALGCDGIFLAVDEPDILSSLLIRLVEARGIFVWAPQLATTTEFIAAGVRAECSKIGNTRVVRMSQGFRIFGAP